MKNIQVARTWFRCALLLCLATLGFSLVNAADSNPPERMTYQGFLTDANGTALATNTPKNFDVIFRLYDSQSGGNLKWSEQQTVTVDKGYFSVLLGDGSAVGSENHGAISAQFASVDASDRFIGITVKGIGAGGADTDILPRLRMLTAPYSYLATKAVSAANLVNSTNGQVVTMFGNNVGINKAVPGVALDVTGAGSLTGGLAVGGAATVAGAVTLNNNLLVPSGKIGVGTTTPSNPVTVVTPQFFHGFEHTDGTVRLATYVGGNNAYIGTLTSHKFNFFVNNQPPSITMDVNGNVGIGSINPVQKLDVRGNILAQKTIRLDPADEPMIVRDYNVFTSGVKTGIGRYGVYMENASVVLGIPSDLPYQTAVKISGWRQDSTREDYVTVVNGTGRVGIGTGAPEAPLHVVGNINQARGNYGYLAPAGNIGFINTGGSIPSPYSIIASTRIAASEFNAISDSRVKEVVALSSGKSDLETIQKLQVTDYRMKDKVAEGDSIRKGFIAQEVEKVIPEAVTRRRDYVPDIYELASSTDYNATDKTLSVKLAKAHGLQQGDHVRLMVEDDKLELVVSTIKSDKEFIVSGCNKEVKKAFVYGKQITDFRTLNYDRIFSTGISAIQELAKRLNERDSRIAALEKTAAKVDAMENELASLKKMVARLAQSKQTDRSVSVPTDASESLRDIAATK